MAGEGVSKTSLSSLRSGSSGVRCPRGRRSLALCWHLILGRVSATSGGPVGTGSPECLAGWLLSAFGACGEEGMNFSSSVPGMYSVENVSFLEFSGVGRSRNYSGEGQNFPESSMRSQLKFCREKCPAVFVALICLRAEPGTPAC